MVTAAAIHLSVLALELLDHRLRIKAGLRAAESRESHVEGSAVGADAKLLEARDELGLADLGRQRRHRALQAATLEPDEHLLEDMREGGGHGASWEIADAEA